MEELVILIPLSKKGTVKVGGNTTVNNTGMGIT